MQVSIENLEGLERKMTVQVPSEQVTEAVDKKLKELSKTVRVDGFRPGKVPVKVIRQKFGPHVRQEVIGEVIESSYREAIVQEKVRPAGMPNIDSLDTESGDEMSYTAIFEVYPEIGKIELDALSVEKPLVDIDDSDLEAMIDKLREQRKNWKESKAAAKKGFQVMVDFEGRIDGELFAGGAGKDMAVEIGAGQMLPEFEQGLEGMKAGEEKVVEVNFPEDYHGKDVAGKTAEFTLKATKVSKPELPEIDEEFIKGFGVEDGDMDKFRGDIRDNMEKEKTDRLKMNIKTRVMDALLEKNDFTVPKALVSEEIKAMRMQAAQRMGQDPENINESIYPDEMFQQEAERRVKLGLLMVEIMEQEEIKLDRSGIDAMLDEMAVGYEQPEQVKEYYRQNEQARASIENMVLEDQIVNHILDQATVTEKSAKFEDLMNGAV